MLSINMADVISFLETVKTHLIVAGILLAVLIVIMIACIAIKSKGTKFLIRGESAMAMILVVLITANLICVGPASTMLDLVSGGGSISEESAENAKELCAEIAEEGIVLLENDGVLPLANTKVNVFGWSSTNPVYGGTGSGALSDAYPTVSLLQGLEEAGIEINSTLTDFYTGFASERPMVGMWGQDWTIPEPTMDEYDAAGIFENAKEFSDTAIIVIARSGGEGADLPKSISSEDTFSADGGMFGASGVRFSSQADDIDPSKHYLELSNREIAMVDRVASEFDNVIVIANTANAMELGWMRDYPSIKGAILCPGTGQTGFSALGEVLTGAINPSGKTVDTFVYDLTATPAYNNAGDFAYDNVAEFESDGVTPHFVNYVEGIYVGYKYYETAAADGFIDYDSTVLYPFGYGLSYTTFSQEMSAISEANGSISFDVTVTNTGSVAGKDVVEIYYNPPYTNGGIEKASANLLDFGKTQLLEPGASETISFTIPVEQMASYDTYGIGGYILEAGDYIISANADSHTILSSQTYTVASPIDYSAGRSNDVEAPSNEFAFAEGHVTYLSRANSFENYAEATAAPASYSMPDDQKATFINNSNYDPANYNNPDDVMPTTGANNGLSLADLRDKAYDDAMWDQLLDQLTVQEMVDLIAMGGYQTAAIDSIGKIRTNDCDGPASINNNFTGQGSIGFPAAVLIASSWNDDMAYQFGQSIGVMADEMDVSGWYAPAMNIHRTAFAGRNFEYYSEDGVLSGSMAANAIVGAEESDVYAYMKHFALNDQETNRCDMVCTWSNEQAIREIYLKPFEISVKEGKCQAVMSSFNYIGTTWAGACSPLLQNVLRGEWGFQGLVLTDYFGVYGYMDADQAIRGGTDFCLVNYPTATNFVTDTESATSVIAMRQATKNILYTVVNSRAYATDIGGGLSSWQTILIVVDVVVGLIVLCGIILIFRKSRKIKAAKG